MKLRELWGIPIPGTEKAVGLKLVTKNYMGKKRTFYEPVGNKINEKKKKGDLYTDDNPKDTIKKLGYKDVSTARASISRIRKYIPLLFAHKNSRAPPPFPSQAHFFLSC